MRSLVFEGNSWAVYEELGQKDRKLYAALCKLLKEMLHGDPSAGLGKPVQLKHELSSLWSRRLSQNDRTLYRYDSASIYIVAIGGHYDQF